MCAGFALRCTGVLPVRHGATDDNTSTTPPVLGGTPVSAFVAPKRWTPEEIDAYIAEQVAAAPPPSPEWIAEVNQILGLIPRAGAEEGADVEAAETVAA